MKACVLSYALTGYTTKHREHKYSKYTDQPINDVLSLLVEWYQVSTQFRTDIDKQVLRFLAKIIIVQPCPNQLQLVT